MPRRSRLVVDGKTYPANLLTVPPDQLGAVRSLNNNHSLVTTEITVRVYNRPETHTYNVVVRLSRAQVEAQLQQLKEVTVVAFDGPEATARPLYLTGHDKGSPCFYLWAAELLDQADQT